MDQPIYNIIRMWDREVFRTAYRKNLPVFLYTSTAINLERMNMIKDSIKETVSKLSETKPPALDYDYSIDTTKLSKEEKDELSPPNECVDGVHLKACFLENLQVDKPPVVTADQMRRKYFDDHKNSILLTLSEIFTLIQEQRIGWIMLEEGRLSAIQLFALRELGYSTDTRGSSNCIIISWT